MAACRLRSPSSQTSTPAMRKAKLSRVSSRPLQLRRLVFGRPVLCQAHRPLWAFRFLVRRALPSRRLQQCLLRPQRVAHPHSHGLFPSHQALRLLKVLLGSSWRQHQFRLFRASVRGPDCRRLMWRALGSPRASPNSSLRRHLRRPQLAARTRMPTALVRLDVLASLARSLRCAQGP